MLIELLSKKAQSNLKNTKDSDLIKNRIIESNLITPGDRKKLQIIQETVTNYLINDNEQKKQIKSTKDARQFFSYKMKHLEHEELHMITVDNKNQLIDYYTVFKGSLNQSVAHPREILRQAIKDSASAIFIAHNHPSGQNTPSQADIDFTNTMNNSCNIVGIRLLDHIIVANDPLSFRQEGYLN